MEPTNLGRPEPPAFPTKTPELVLKVRGLRLLLKATRWCSSQSMYKRTSDPCIVSVNLAHLPVSSPILKEAASWVVLWRMSV